MYSPSMTRSATHYFSKRAAEAVLTGCSLEAGRSLESYLTRLLQSSAEPQPSSAQITLSVEPEFSVDIQLVQSHPVQPQFPPGVRAPLCSLVTAAASGLQVSSLLQTGTQKTAEDEESSATVSSLQLSLKGKCSSLQISLAAQLSSSGGSSGSFPNLLTNSHQRARLVGPSSGVCSLLEAGCMSLSFTVAAKVVTMEVSPRAILTWEHVQTMEVDRSARPPCLQQREEVSHQLAISVSLPQVWADVAAPHIGRPSASTGVQMLDIVCELLVNCLGRWPGPPAGF